MLGWLATRTNGWPNKAAFEGAWGSARPRWRGAPHLLARRLWPDLLVGDGAGHGEDGLDVLRAGGLELCAAGQGCSRACETRSTLRAAQRQEGR